VHRLIHLAAAAMCAALAGALGAVDGDRAMPNSEAYKIEVPGFNHGTHLKNTARPHSDWHWAMFFAPKF
jgi:hypothetical protein